MINNQTVNALRFLSADAVEKANSGHPGMPLGMADIAEVLWRDHLNHNPKNPLWFNRDRFVLSNGHGSMLLYSLLHLSGYDLSIDDIKEFRQLGSKTPGHPEVNVTPGVETTTGPLGQGLANAVGMALAEKILSAKLNTPDIDIIDHYTYCFLGDGCLMEGISHEAMSLAGVHELGKLICFYDSNGISIDGKIDEWYKDDIAKRCEAYNWHVIDKVNGHDREAINKAIEKAKISQRPTMIVCKTSIGYGAGKKQDSESSHGAALGPEIIKELRENLQWPHPEFFIPKNIYYEWDATERGKALESEWDALKDKFKDSAPEKYDLLQRLMVDRLPETFDQDFNSFVSKLAEKTDDIATRKASQIILEELTNKLPELIGGSADLSGSNNTNTSKSISITDDPSGNYIFYGVREFGMNAIMNGISLHGGLIPYAGTFLVFMDYGRNAVRMSSLMGIKTIFVFSHDSIALGEDGPTHQPIEHLSTLRATPNMSTWRPANLTETAAAWLNALKNENSPTSIILSRQNLRHFVTSNFEDACSGGYFVKKMPNAKINLIATGSEVTVALDASEILKKEGIEVNIASVPCIEALEQNKKRYDSIFGSDISIAIECSHPSSWYKHTKRVIGIDAYGESGSGNDLLSHFGFTAAKIAQRIKEIL